MVYEHTSNNTDTQHHNVPHVYGQPREGDPELLPDVRDYVKRDTNRESMGKVSSRLKEVKEYTAEALGKAGVALKKDMASTAERLGPKWGAFSEKSGDLFDVWRDRSSLFLGAAAVRAGTWMQKLGQKLEHQSYLAGEIAYGGTFCCKACGEHRIIQRTGHLPPCHKCSSARFQRI